MKPPDPRHSLHAQIVPGDNLVVAADLAPGAVLEHWMDGVHRAGLPEQPLAGSYQLQKLELHEHEGTRSLVLFSRQTATSDETANAEALDRYRDYIGLSEEGIWRFEFEEPVPLNLDLEEQVHRLLTSSRLAECNQAMCVIAGVPSPGYLLGRPASQLLRPLDEEKIAGLRKFAEGSYTEQALLIRHVDVNGREKFLERLMRGVVKDGRLQTVWGNMRDVTARVRAENVVTNLARGVSALTGDRFFHQLALLLGKSLESDHAAVCEVPPGNPTVLQSLAAFELGQFTAQRSIPLDGAPAKRVLETGSLIIPDWASEAFPGDVYLREFGIRGYAASRLLDSKGAPIGLLAVLSRRPLENPEFIQYTLEAFAARAAAELERTRNEQTIQESEIKYRAFVSRSTDGIFCIRFRNPVPVDVSPRDLEDAIESNAVVEECNEAMRAIASRHGDPAGRSAMALDLPWKGKSGWSQTLVKHNLRADQLLHHATRADGNPAVVLVSLTAMASEGFISCIWGTARDVTAQVAMEQQVRALSIRRASLLEEERSRVAREMYDELGQDLSAMSLHLAALTAQLSPEAASLRDSLKELSAQVSKAIGRTQRFASDFRPPVLDYFGLGPAVEWYAGEFEKVTGTRCEVDVAAGLRVSGELATAAFRMIQECLKKLSEAGISAIFVGLSVEAQDLIIRIVDNRDSRSALNLPDPQGTWLELREFAAEAGGSLAIDEAPSTGWALKVRYPVTSKD